MANKANNRMKKDYLNHDFYGYHSSDADDWHCYECEECRVRVIEYVNNYTIFVIEEFDNIFMPTFELKLNCDEYIIKNIIE